MSGRGRGQRIIVSNVSYLAIDCILIFKIYIYLFKKYCA